MGYISTCTWRDLTDGHLYCQGDSFPYDGRDVPAERLEELETGRNMAGLRLITPSEGADEAQQAQTEETPKKAKKPRKTGTQK